MDQIDLSVFKKKQNIKCKNNKYDKCNSMARLLVALKYYSVLNITENDNDCEIFRKFMHDVYYQLINDYIHFNNKHTHELEHINNELMDHEHSLFIKCDVSSCIYTTRHHKKTIKNNLDNVMNFYKQTMDSLHFYLFHCFDVGIRTKKENQPMEDEEEKKTDQYFDATFSRINQMISERAHIATQFDRFSTDKNTKFNIKTGQDEMKNVTDNMTCLDAIYDHLQNENVNQSDIERLNQFLQDEEYDTDSFGYDINITFSNIMKCIDEQDCFCKITTFIQAGKVLSTSFSIGLRFYYWKYYKKRKQLDLSEQVIDFVRSGKMNNYNNHSGYSICDLFVIPRYQNFKEEISFYKYITIMQYKKEAVVKVRKYIKAKIVKKTKVICGYPYGNPYVARYGFKEGDALTFKHLLSIVFYCDYTDLCTDFSKTFRKNTRYERLASIKKRNSKYYWLSRYLREAVEVYGQCSRGDDLFNSGEVNEIRGPFYTGLNVLLYISQFNIRLCSPTSTSTQIQVAIKFSGEDGIILQFNNPYGLLSQCAYLRCFNVSWLSRYKEEDERLFFGGFYPIQIQSVRIRNTNKNFEKFIYSLYYLDRIFTAGSFIYDHKISKSNILVIKHLFANILNEKTTISLDEYIYHTFAAFVQSKTQIELDLDELYRTNEQIRALLMNRMCQRLQNEERIRLDTDDSNLFVPKMLLIFKNVKSIIIKTTGFGVSMYGGLIIGECSYSLSMICLLSLLESSSVDKVIIKANTHYPTGANWISKLWSTNNKRLKECYNEKKYNISEDQNGVLIESIKTKKIQF